MINQDSEMRASWIIQVYPIRAEEENLQTRRGPREDKGRDGSYAAATPPKILEPQELEEARKGGSRESTAPAGTLTLGF